MNKEVEVNEIMLKQFAVKQFLIYITQWCIFEYLSLFSEFFIQMSDTVFYFSWQTLAPLASNQMMPSNLLRKCSSLNLIALMGLTENTNA